MWVRCIEHAAPPIHDHRFGACDLPDRPTREETDTRCRWETDSLSPFGRTCCSGCPHRFCRNERQRMNKTANRDERRAGRREARRYLRGGDDD
ncbi:hypothetical protein FHR81_001260 [Actinoalloteichus hoggarensis]|uniref:Uncharacterized protein n=1 Tax=Actinoalloteichus hoggarensis TaxID=1470176 RepID=A0A221VZR2_9PSEU|nr:hypothetical protein [Actinoalloteichus hoggarensis]ASO18994.1 hypothetical protein AHOG_06730 [Actinoalloteichus hoggarensis]MBB5920230.1 hypothetical protein [Actinoalloteichus hoggarensis]